jgi:NADH-quinone oxidoreductase subunit B
MKMLPVLQRIWLQMHEPKWCISMGACASTGGVFDTYAVVQGIDRFIPVDMYVPGCPPRPEQLIQAIIDLQDKIQREGTITGREFDTAERQLRKRALVDSSQLLSLDAARNPVVQRELSAAAQQH